ncbi:MAG: hypothetical protein ACKVJK_20875, partial [Methylophagaceae bacterium]
MASATGIHYRPGIDILAGNSVGAQGVDIVSATDSLTGDSKASLQAFLALTNGAMSSGVCAGFTVKSVGASFITGAAKNNISEEAAKGIAADMIYGVVIDDKVYHNPTICQVAGDRDAASSGAYLTYGATLLPAITPLNAAT